MFRFRIWVWNDLLVALVFPRPRIPTAILTAQLNELVGSRGEDWHLLAAGAFVSMVVPPDRLLRITALLPAWAARGTDLRLVRVSTPSLYPIGHGL